MLIRILVTFRILKKKRMRKLFIIHLKLFSEAARARKYTAWEPPGGGEQREGKKIIPKRSRSVEPVIEELD